MSLHLECPSVLPYAGPASGRKRIASQSWWGTASAVMALLTTAYCAMCIDRFLRSDWLDAGTHEWIAYGFIGNWMGGGLGILLGLIGSFQCTARRSRAVSALLGNTLIVGVPLGLIGALWWILATR